MPNIKAYAALEAGGKLQPHDYDPGEGMAALLIEYGCKIYGLSLYRTGWMRVVQGRYFAAGLQYLRQ